MQNYCQDPVPWLECGVHIVSSVSVSFSSQSGCYESAHWTTAFDAAACLLLAGTLRLSPNCTFTLFID